MPNLNPSEAQHTDDPIDTMAGDNWATDINNYREAGMAVASFNNAIGYSNFIGTAEMVVEDGIRHLEIHLYCDETEKFTCQICNSIPKRPTSDNPGICTFCGLRVCESCRRKHEHGHWRPQKTIGGDVICTKERGCGKDQCPICGGIPF